MLKKKNHSAGWTGFDASFGEKTQQLVNTGVVENNRLRIVNLLISGSFACSLVNPSGLCGEDESLGNK